MILLRTETGGGGHVKAIMNLPVPYNAGHFLSSCESVMLSGRTLFHGGTWLVSHAGPRGLWSNNRTRRTQNICIVGMATDKCQPFCIHVGTSTLYRLVFPGCSTAQSSHRQASLEDFLRRVHRTVTKMQQNLDKLKLYGTRKFLFCAGYDNTLAENTNRNSVHRKFHSIICHEGPEREYRYSSTLALPSALDAGGWLTPRPGRFTPGKVPGTHYTRCWVDPRAGLNGYGISRPHRDSIPGPFSP